ncbi:MAG: histidine kinase [Kangiellaceae bacterium]|nr:histidine kinase [Kangiellaceae bacterium]
MTKMKNQPTDFASQDTDEAEVLTKSSSIVARAGQIMGVIIFLSLLSMISSMLVSESLSGDAAQINNAGALRMQALRVSRSALTANEGNGDRLLKEIAEFDLRLNKVYSGGVSSDKELAEISDQFQLVQSQWQKYKQQKHLWTLDDFDAFVLVIDKFVSLLQVESEKKLTSLRLIQGISLLAVLIVSATVLLRLHKVVVVPLRQIVEVARRTGQGDFEGKADYRGENELGVLAKTINQMSAQLKLTYQDFEDRVEQKTLELTQSNRSLELLFHAASKLASEEYHQFDLSLSIVEDIELMLEPSKVTLERSGSELTEDKSSSNERSSFNRIEFPLEKQSQLFGYLVWWLPKHQSPQVWQTQLLQAMADLIGTAVHLEQKRNTEDRLLIAEERAVIARELHDSLAQSLSYLKVQLSLLTRKVEKQVEQPLVTETINDIKQGLNKAYSQLRELLTTFRLKLDDPSIENALQGTVAEFSVKCHHPVELDFQLPQNFLSANQEIHVLQIVREALSNVQRHAEATHAGVKIGKQKELVRVNIWDDGKGLKLPKDQKEHLGIGIMEERANSLNAQIEIRDRENQGTEVEISFSKNSSSRKS